MGSDVLPGVKMFGLRYTAITLVLEGLREGKVEHVHPLRGGWIRSNYLVQTRKTENSICTSAGPMTQSYSPPY